MYWNIIAILKARGITPAARDFLLVDNSDGQGPFIEFWDEAKLGPKPSQADLDAVQAEADALQVEALKDPTDELMAAISDAIKDEPPGSPVRRLGEALIGQADRAGRVAGRPT